MKVNHREIHDAYGRVLEQVTGELKDAVVGILGYHALEEEAAKKMAVDERLRMPSDIAGKLDAFDEGKQLGIQLALSALTNPGFIMDERDKHKDQFEE